MGVHRRRDEALKDEGSGKQYAQYLTVHSCSAFILQCASVPPSCHLRLNFLQEGPPVHDDSDDSALSVDSDGLDLEDDDDDEDERRRVNGGSGNVMRFAEALLGRW